MKLLVLGYSALLVNQYLIYVIIDKNIQKREQIMEIVKGSSKNPVVDKMLIDFFTELSIEEDSTLYVG